MSAFKNLLKSDDKSTSGMSGQGSHFGRNNDEPALSEGQTPGTASSTTSPQDDGEARIGSTTTYSSRPLASGDPVGSVVDHESKDPMTYRRPEHYHSEAAETVSGGVPSGAAAIAASKAFESNMSGNENPYRAQHGLDPRVDGGRAVSGNTGSSQARHTGPASGLTGAGAGTGTGTGMGASTFAGATPSQRREEPSTTHSSTGPAPSGLTSTRDHSDRAGTFAGATPSQRREEPSTTYSSTEQAPSSLTSTRDPSDRAATYSGATGTQGLDHANTSTNQPSAATTSSLTDTSRTTDHPQSQAHEEPSIAGKVLGALGLGGAAASAASALGYGSKAEGSNEPHDTSALATHPGAVSQETSPPKHYRRESIPTTAYPGPSAAQPIAAPIGGTRPSVSEEIGNTSHPHSSGFSQSSGPQSGIGAPSAGLRSSEYDRDMGVAQPRSGHQPMVGTGSAIPTSSDHARDISAGQPHSTVHDQITMDPGQAGRDLGHSHTDRHFGSSHTGRDLAAGGAAGAAAGAGAYALHEHRQNDPQVAGTHNIGAPGPSVPHHPRETYTISSSAGAQPAAGTTGTTTLPDRSREPPMGAVAAAPGRFDSQDARPVGTTSSAPYSDRRDDHTARNAAIGAGAGAAVAGGAGYAAHDKELERQREHERKEMEKAQQKHEKEIAKEQKHHQHEAEKAEKHHQRELEKQHTREEKRHHKEVEKEEEEMRRRREKEAAAGVGAAGVAGAGATEYDRHHHQTGHDTEHADREKKPSIFKRIFKSRKNKDTGEDEEYSTDEEPEKITHGSHVPTHHSSTKDRNVLGAAHGNTSDHRDPATGLAYDPNRDLDSARRLDREPGADAPYGRGTETAHLGASHGVGATGPGTTSGLSHHIPTPAEVGNLGEITDHKR